MTYHSLDEGAMPVKRNLHDVLLDHGLTGIHVGGPDWPNVTVTLDGPDARRLTEILRDRLDTGEAA